MKGNKPFLAQISPKFLAAVIRSTIQDNKDAADLRQNSLYLIKAWGEQYTFVNGAPSEFFKAYDKLKKTKTRFPESFLDPQSLAKRHVAAPSAKSEETKASPPTKKKPAHPETLRKKPSPADIETEPAPKPVPSPARSPAPDGPRTTPHREAAAGGKNGAPDQRSPARKPVLGHAKELMARLRRSMDLWTHERSAFQEMEQNVKRLATQVASELKSGHKEPSLLALSEVMKELPILMARARKNDATARTRIADLCESVEDGRKVEASPASASSAPKPRAKASGGKIQPKRQVEDSDSQPDSASPPKPPSQTSNAPAVWGEMPSFGTKRNCVKRIMHGSCGRTDTFSGEEARGGGFSARRTEEAGCSRAE